MPILINNPRLQNYYNKIRPVLRDARVSAYFMLILSLFSISFFGIFAINPTLKTIAQLQKETADSQEAYKKLQEKNRNLLVLQGEYRKIESDLPLVYAALPKEVSAPIFLLKIRTLAKSNNLELSNLLVSKSPLSEVQEGELTAIAFSLTASGKYQDINSFLGSLTKLDRIVGFNSLEITPAAMTEGAESLTLGVSGKIYTLFE